MNIWLIDHYAVPPQYYPLARQTTFAKYLIRMGHTVTIIAASSVHNSDVNLTEGNRRFIEKTVDGVPYVLIRCRQYEGNGAKRFLNMMEFAAKLPRVCDRLPRPDAIVSTSMTLFACKKGLQLSEKYGCKKIAQITDLWPESIVAYGMAGGSHPIVRYLRRMEKWIYTHADTLIFSMEGAYDYIREQGWQEDVPEQKVHYINNGVDLEVFRRNRDSYPVDDPDLIAPDAFKVVYTGSIRRANDLGRLLDAAKLVKNPKVRFLIWGAGDELAALKQRVADEHIGNVCFKGRVDKRYIPYITSHADVNIMHGEQTPILRFGLSANKLFDYFASGRPIFTDFDCGYNPADRFNAQIRPKAYDSAGLAEAIDAYAAMPPAALAALGENAAKASETYNFEKLTAALAELLEG